jgi:hypothetical protein
MPCTMASSLRSPLDLKCELSQQQAQDLRKEAPMLHISWADLACAAVLVLVSR